MNKQMILQFAWRQKRWHLKALLAALALAIIAGWMMGDQSAWSYLEPFLSILTLVTAALIWVGELHQEWIESLPKRLTICFLYPPEDASSLAGKDIAILCIDAYLAGENDIRALGQSVGGQVAGKPLNFSPLIQQLPPTIETIGNELCRSYQVLFQLYNKLPQGKDDTKEEFPFMKDHKTMVWNPSKSLKFGDQGAISFKLDPSSRRLDLSKVQL